MTAAEIRRASRAELVAYLEGVRCIACYDDEPLSLLRQCALEDLKAVRDERKRDR